MPIAFLQLWTLHIICLARELDDSDSLAGFRARFYSPAGKIYLDGNSLGLLSRDAERTLLGVLGQWKTGGIGGWLEGDSLAKLEGILPALESAHAIAYAVRLARKLPRSKTLVVNLSGRGDKDLANIQSPVGKKRTRR